MRERPIDTVSWYGLRSELDMEFSLSCKLFQATKMSGQDELRVVVGYMRLISCRVMVSMPLDFAEDHTSTRAMLGAQCCCIKTYPSWTFFHRSRLTAHVALFAPYQYRIIHIYSELRSNCPSFAFFILVCI